MPIEFASSARSTLGIEWELALVDPESKELTPAAPAILAQLDDDHSTYPQITEELLTNTVEIVSGAHASVAEAVADLSGMLREVRSVALEHNALIMSAGSHPFSRWDDQQVTQKERYTNFMEEMRWWGGQLLIWGVHVHVGVEHRDKALALMNGVLNFFPHLQALSASSPYYCGVDTGYASNRAMLFQQASTAGLPPSIHKWDDYERYVDDVVKTSIVAESSELRWDVRPSPRWGTLEVRICDAPATVAEVGAVAALTQCIVEDLSTRLDDGNPMPDLQPWFVSENKWRSARFGLECDAIIAPDGVERPLLEEVQKLIDRLEPVAERLGCAAELRSVDDILTVGPSYQRQLAVDAHTDGDLAAVVDSLVTDLELGTLGA
ncbi:glutamate--cysteine ligase [Lysobacter korlensis]|uniref:Putative glutamate--cysteine ligase 2 n=1 Tax=Lysobacter korlensis TaxID=553636 RepID=A0ABV6RNS2_9GAMM